MDFLSICYFNMLAYQILNAFKPTCRALLFNWFELQLNPLYEDLIIELKADHRSIWQQ